MTSVYDTSGQILLAVIGFVVFVLFLFWLWLICQKKRNYQGKIIYLIINIINVKNWPKLILFKNDITYSKNPFLLLKNEFQNCENS